MNSVEIEYVKVNCDGFNSEKAEWILVDTITKNESESEFEVDDDSFEIERKINHLSQMNTDCMDCGKIIISMSNKVEISFICNFCYSNFTVFSNFIKHLESNHFKVKLPINDNYFYSNENNDFSTEIMTCTNIETESKNQMNNEEIETTNLDISNELVNNTITDNDDDDDDDDDNSNYSNIECNIENGLLAKLPDDDKSSKCRFCKRKCKSRYLRDRHEAIHTGIKLHVCEICNKRFRLKYELQRHILAHKGIKPHKCNICSIAFTDQGNLKKHIRIHTGERPFKCNYCDKACITSSELKGHIRYHTGERPFLCTECGLNFISSSALTQHRRTHSNFKPYKCSICERAFYTPWKLKSHELIHAAVKPFECDICFKRFNSKKNANRHKKTIHSNM